MSKHRYAADATVTVHELCRAAGLVYGMLGGAERVIRLRVSGGSAKYERAYSGRPVVYVDVSHVSGDKHIAAREILETLAFDLDVYEAGESLMHARIAEPLIRGGYVPYGTATDRRDAFIPHRFAHDKTVTVSDLCRAAEIPYSTFDGHERYVRLRLSGGHACGERHMGVTRLYVDVSEISDELATAARWILVVLAYQLDCVEARDHLNCPSRAAD